MKKRIAFLALALLPMTVFAQQTISTIGFGSCMHQDKDTPILQAINQAKPELFVFLGDNVYGDTRNMNELAAKYQKQAAKPNFQTLRKQSQTIAIWDDHDFGENDAGGDYPHKQASKQIMLDFWQEPAKSERRQRDSGIYTSYFYGPAHQRIQVILPDLRWNRPGLNEVNKLEYIASRVPKDMGPYQPSTDPQASMLGQAQWAWLEQELKKPAKIKIIASSLQLLADFTGWEAWANYPYDRNRLLRFIQSEQINGVIIVSGDTHWGELSKLEQGLDYPLWEVTSSGLNQEWKQVSPNQHRVGAFTSDVNFGWLNVNWQATDPLLTFGLKDISGQWVKKQNIALSTISPYPLQKEQ